MVSYPDITVLIVTFARLKETLKTIGCFLQWSNYPLQHTKFHLSDNDTKSRAGIKDYVSTILNYHSALDWSHTIEKSPGWGNNVNTALNNIKTDYIFLIEDDRAAYDTINILDGVRLMEAKKDIGLVRYDGIAGHTGLELRLNEVKTKDCRFSYCEIDHKKSIRPITYSNQPHLRHKRFTKYYGLYPENVKLGMCEKMYAVHVKRNPDGPKTVILQDGIQNRFSHLGAGRSRQHTKWDK